MTAPDSRAASGTRRAVALAIAVLCVAYLPLFAGRILFTRDVAHWNHPARFFLRAAFARGESPLWNPDQGLGFATLANPLYGLFYPPNWLYFVTPERLVAALVTWQAFAHLCWGAAGVVLLARRFGCRPAAAAAAGIAWGLSGFTTGLWTAGLLLLAAAWVPWCGLGFVALAGAAGGDRRALARGVAAAAAPASMALLLGEVFVAAMGVGFGLALGAALVRRSPRAVAARLAGAAGLALLLAAAAATVVWLPARAAAQGTERAAPLPRDTAEVWSTHPVRVIEMVAPGAMGASDAGTPAMSIIGDARVDGLPLVHSVYLGAAALALALAAFGRGRRAAAAVAVIATVALLLAFGRHTPLHQGFRAVVRPLAYMRYPEKYLTVLAPAFALLVGLGLERVLSGQAPRRRLLAFVGALAVLAAIAPALFPPGWSALVTAAALRAAAVAAVVLAAIWLLGRAPRLGAGALVAVVSLDLASAAWPYLDFVSPEVATRRPPAADVVLAGRAAGGPGPRPRVYRANAVDARVARLAQPPSRAVADAYGVATLIMNTVNVFGIAALPGYDAAIPSALSRLWEAGRAQGQSLLRLFGAEWAVLPVDDPAAPDGRAGLAPALDPVPGARLYRVPGALPRAYLAGRAEITDDATAGARLLAAQVVGGGVALLAPTPGAAPLDGAPARAGSCTVEHFANVQLRARCHAEREAVAVFVEQHAAGWSADVDGRSAPLLRANLLMRAVRVGPGDHVITLSYSAPHVGTGATLSLAAMAALAALAWAGRRRA